MPLFDNQECQLMLTAVFTWKRPIIHIFIYYIQVCFYL